ncbi:MAG: CHAT domain-containing protein [Pseudanabaena sp.]|jgi:hypothetical protein
MIRTYYTYRIRVANRERVQVEKLNLQRTSEGEPSGAFRYQSNKKKLEPLLQLACNGELNDTGKSRLLGETLFNILFDDVLRQDFVNFYYQVVQQQKQFLRVELDIDEQRMPEVAALPWEFICLPDNANLGTVWIATAPYLVFSRRRSQWIAAQPIQLAVNEKLRIALVISVPSDLPAVVYEPVQIALEKLAGEQINQVELLPIVNAANPESINEILAQQPHIFHFIGHGRLENDTNQAVGQIALVDPDLGEAMWVDADYFSQLFNRYRPGIVMLQACEGGMLSASQAFVGVASRIVEQNIPVVVAMQYEVSNSTASRFASCFYKNLAAFNPVDIAAQEGRLSIALGAAQFRKRDFATPVIFMRVEDGYLFIPPEPQTVKPSIEDNSHAVRQGIEAIRELVTNSPEVYHTVLNFRADLQSASKELNTLGDYKKLHDALHRVEFDCYNLIQVEVFKWQSKNKFEENSSDSSDFEDSLFNLMRYDSKLQKIVKQSQEIVAKANLAASEVVWVVTLSNIREEFHMVLETAETISLNTLTRQLKEVAKKIDHILGQYPNRIDMCLNRSAQDLNLSALLETLKTLQQQLEIAGGDMAKLSQFQVGVVALEALQKDLKIRIEEHTEWQKVDSQLRRMAGDAYRLKDYTALQDEWEYLKPDMEPLYTTCDDDTHSLFEKKRDLLDKAIAEGNPSRIKRCFIDYRSFAADRFFQIDDDLKNLCENLRPIAVSLNLLLELIDERR